MKSKKVFLVFEKMFLERPIEQALLEYVREMKKVMEDIITKKNDKFLWIDLDKDLKEGALHYASAYECVEDRILWEIEIRKITKPRRKEGKK